MTATVAGKLTLETQLRRALDREEFVLHYQPKIAHRGRRITGAEALIRWNDPARASCRRRASSRCSRKWA
jgi:sensor c-di-GMP phosphodiesterase-like protein